MPRKPTVIHLQSEISRLNDVLGERDVRVRELLEEQGGARSEISAVTSKLTEERLKVAKLKTMVLDRDQAIADLNGYLRRVHEDDNVRDGDFVHEQPGHTTRIPKRQPMRTAAEYLGVQTPSGYKEAAEGSRQAGAMAEAMAPAGSLEAVNRGSIDERAHRGVGGRPRTWRDDHWLKW